MGGDRLRRSEVDKQLNGVLHRELLYARRLISAHQDRMRILWTRSNAQPHGLLRWYASPPAEEMGEARKAF